MSVFYPLITKWLGKDIFLQDPYGHIAVSAADLETKLAEGFQVFGDDNEFSNYRLGNSVAIAIGKQPIKKKTKEETALEFIEDITLNQFTDDEILIKARAILEMK